MSTAEMLDSTQYSVDSIRQYEAVFGEDFVSPGGQIMATELIGKMQLAPGSRVLDVGCGLGGSCFVMARDFGLLAEGIDLSRNMLSIALQKSEQYGLSDSIKMTHGDCLELDCPQHYDAIYSRDVFLHISDKSHLFTVLHSALKAGGELLFTDYCCGEKPWNDAFADYVEGRGYSLHTLPGYAAFVAEAGFAQLRYEDLTERFIDILLKDLDKIQHLDLDQMIRDKLQQSWSGKLQRAKSGDHRWGLFRAIK